MIFSPPTWNSLSDIKPLPPSEKNPQQEWGKNYKIKAEVGRVKWIKRFKLTLFTMAQEGREVAGRAGVAQVFIPSFELSNDPGHSLCKKWFMGQDWLEAFFCLSICVFYCFTSLSCGLSIWPQGAFILKYSGLGSFLGTLQWLIQQDLFSLQTPLGTAWCH